MRVIAFVPIKFESRRLKNKNFLDLAGKPLCYYIFEKLLAIPEIDKVYVYCSQESIMQYLPQNVMFLKRPSELDSDQTLGMDIYQSFISIVKADVYVLAHATSPLVNLNSIQSGLSAVMNHQYDSAHSVIKHKIFAWYQNKPLNYSLDHIVRTQNIEPVYLETSAFYIFTSEVINNRRRIGDNPYHVCLDKMEAIDIDHDDDFRLASSILENNNQIIINGKTKSSISKIKLIIFDFDGCFTNGTINLDSKGNVIKGYYTLDGEATVNIMEKGYKVGILSGNSMDFFKKKARKWGLTFCQGDVKDKLKWVSNYITTIGLTLDQIAYFGDGLNDIKIMEKVGFTGSPLNAHPKTKQIANYLCKNSGGQGAIREFLELFD